MNQEMMAAPLLRPIITEKGLAAANQAATLGKAVVISHVTMSAVPGEASYTDETLVGQGELLAVADGRVVSPTQVNISALIPDTYPTTDVCGIAFYLDDGTLFAIYRELTPILYHKTGETLLLGLDFAMSNIPSDSVIVESTGANLVFGDWVPETRRINGKNLKADITLTHEDVKAVPLTRKVNNKALDKDLTLTHTDVGAVPTTRKVNNKALDEDLTLTLADLGYTAPDMSGYVPTTRKVNNKPLSGDISLNAADVGASPSNHGHSDLVPTTRRINGKDLKADVMLNAVDVNAAPSGFGLGEEQAYTVEDMNTDPMTWNGGKMGWVRGISTTLNRPGGHSGVAIVQRYQRGATSSVNVLYFAGSKTFTRHWSESAWGDWAELYSTSFKPTPADIGAVATVDLEGLAIGKPKSLNKENLNDLGVGVYRQKLNANTSAELNYPENQAGAITCYETSSGQLVQEYRPYNANKTYTRVKHSSSWGSWALVYSTQNKPSAADVGAVPTTRKVNNKALSSDITLTAGDIGAAPASHSHGQYALNSLNINGYQLTGDFNLNAANVGAYPVTGGRLNGSIWAADAISTDYISGRDWGSMGAAAFSQKQQMVSDGMLTGTTSTTHHFSGYHVVEYATGAISSANIERGAHVLWATDGGNFNRLWMLRNEGTFEAPGGVWHIGNTGMLSGSCWGGALDAWISKYYASIGHNHTAASGNYDIVSGNAGLVGCYAMMGTFYNNTGPIVPGQIVPGSALMWANAEGTAISGCGFGSWMALGHTIGDRDYGVWNVTLFIRIA